MSLPNQICVGIDVSNVLVKLNRTLFSQPSARNAPETAPR